MTSMALVGVGWLGHPKNDMNLRQSLDDILLTAISGPRGSGMGRRIAGHWF
jgi:hypothetical protein